MFVALSHPECRATALIDGALPEADWGGDFLPSEVDAVAAAASPNLTIDVRAGVADPVSHFTSVAQNMGLQRIVDEA